MMLVLLLVIEYFNVVVLVFLLVMEYFITVVLVPFLVMEYFRSQIGTFTCNKVFSCCGISTIACIEVLFYSDTDTFT